jgi:sortase (surface protein transpeptidase)
VPSQDPRLLPPQPITGVDATTSAAAPVGVPARVRIPAIGVDAPVTRLGREPDGAMQAPPDWEVPGWYAGGPRPGQVGPAVIAGHIDSLSGPAVFFRLGLVRTGDEVLVTTDAGRVLRFVVDERQTFTKARFPSHLVYGPQPVPVLRLITCTGAFDAATGSYLSNLVVSAHLA